MTCSDPTDPLPHALRKNLSARPVTAIRRAPDCFHAKANSSMKLHRNRPFKTRLDLVELPGGFLRFRMGRGTGHAKEFSPWVSSRSRPRHLLWGQHSKLLHVLQ